jgi:DNA-binding protein
VNESNEAVVVICGQRTEDYLARCLGLVNAGTNVVKLRAIGSSILASVQLSQMLAEHFGGQIGSSRISTLDVYELGLSNVLETTVKWPAGAPAESKDVSLVGPGFMEYPLYHLLFDHLLNRKGKLELVFASRPDEVLAQPDVQRSVDSTSKGERSEKGIQQRKDFRVVIEKENGGIVCKSIDPLTRTDTQNLTQAYYRAGLLVSPNRFELVKELSRFDDIIVAPDTNILHTAIPTQHLFPPLALANTQYCQKPNWLLLVIPSSVIHELEQAANLRDKKGLLTYAGRKGYRALAEILDIDLNPEYLGISLAIVGEANPVLDTRVELRGLRQDFARGRGAGKPSLSSGDMIIRDQFKTFLRQLGFHKGAYFLTGDKSSAALAKAEGLRSLYIKQPHVKAESMRNMSVKSPTVVCKPADITFEVPVGSLIYELAVQFGTMGVRWGDGRGPTGIRVECDRVGETLDHWMSRGLNLEFGPVRDLVREYDSTARMPLGKVRKEWRNLKLGAEEL